MRRRGVCLALVLGAMLAACGGGRGAAETDAGPLAPVQDLLRQRAERLRAGDLDGYLAALAPEARAFEEPIARSALALPLVDIDMTIGTATISDDGNRLTDAHVVLRYGYGGLPEDNPFRLRLLYDIERRGGGLVVTRSRFDDGGESPPPPLWATGPVDVTRSERFVVLARPGTARVREMVEQAEQGLARLLPGLVLEADQAFLLVLAGDEPTYRAVGGPPGSVAFAAVEYIATAGRLPRPEERHTGVNLPDLLELAEARLESERDPVPGSVVFQHELAHLALSRFTRPCTPPWVAEGAAMSLAGEDRSDGWRALVDGGGLDVITLNPGDPDLLDYSVALAAVRVLLARGGPSTFFDFYQNFKSLPEEGCAGRVDNVRSRLDERLLRRYYRLTVAELEAMTRDHVAKAVAGP